MKISRWIVRVVLAATAQSILPSLAITQLGAPPNPEMAQTCPGLVAGNYPTVIPASWQVSGSLMGAPKLGELNSGAFNLAALNSDQVRLTFLGHATFLIESPQLVRIATDYNGYIKPPLLPDIAHHESCAQHALHRLSRPGDQIRAAGLGRESRSARQLGPEISRRAGAQRADQYPELLRQHHDRALRQLDLYLRDCQSVHHASRTSASYADATAA